MDVRNDDDLAARVADARDAEIVARVRRRRLEGELHERACAQDPIARIGRRRYRRWASLVALKLEGGTDLRVASDVATRTIFPRFKSARAVDNKTRELLAIPEIAEPIADAVTRAGFPPSEAMRTLVEHIRRGHYPALIWYLESIALPATTAQLERRYLS